MVGVSHGILVGSFVDQSESLWEAAQNGKGARYIHALFEDTLAGWRSQADREAPRTGSLANALKDVFIFAKVKPGYVELAQKWGATPQPKELWEALLNVKNQRWRMAPMHGDMHGENVRVRNGEAIIIDLANVTTGPLCADLASLDVWLSFEVPRNPEAIPDRAVWAGVVKELYSPVNAAKIPSQEHVDVGFDWLRGSIRPIRMISASICECASEYPTALALHLLRRACYDPDPPHADEDRHRRAYAYWLGAELVTQLVRSAELRSP